MIEQCVFSAFFLCLFTFNGSLYMRLLCKRKQTLPSIKSFFAGFIINGIYFELIHLFLPLSIYTLIPLVLFFVYEAVFQFMQNRHIIKNLLHKPKTSLSYILLSFFAFFITYVVLYSVKNSSLNSYDTYLYHASFA